MGARPNFKITLALFFFYWREKNEAAILAKSGVKFLEKDQVLQMISQTGKKKETVLLVR